MSGDMVGKAAEVATATGNKDATGHQYATRNQDATGPEKMVRADSSLSQVISEKCLSGKSPFP